MPLLLETAQYLLSAPGLALTREAESLRDGHVDPLQALTRLRRSADGEQCAAAWELAVLRLRAAAKFGPDAARLFVTRESMEQASGVRASAYHAARLAQMGATHVQDVCGGVGGDALAFARAGLSVTLYEIDPVRALFAQANSEACGLSGRVEVRREDVTGVVLGAGGVWFDPARRAGGRRIADPDDYVPPLLLARTWADAGRLPLGVKLSPTVEHGLAREYGASLEFVSDGGECKEGLLWRSPGTADTGEVRAVLLEEGGVRVLAGPPELAAPLEDAPGGAYLYEPDPAVIRAHLVGTLAGLLGARAVDAQIAYLVSDRLTPTPWARAWEIVERFGYSRRGLQEALTRLGVGQVIVKKRGFPLEPDAVRRQLKLSGPNALTVVLTRQGAGHGVFLCRPA